MRNINLVQTSVISISNGKAGFKSKNLKKLILTAGNENATKADRIKAIEALQKISIHFRDLTFENISTDLSGAVRNYIQSFLKVKDIINPN